VVPGFCTSDAEPELFLPIGNAGQALLQLDQANRYGVHSPYAAAECNRSR
jgi:hypothetical protein